MVSFVDLQQLLEEAQHVLAFSLPPVLWSYTPREFNRCADYLAGIARDHVKEHLTQSSAALFSLPPFFFPLPPSLQSQFSAVSPLSIQTSLPTLTFPELPSLPMKFSPLLFRLYKHSPSITRYLRAIYSLRTSSLQGLSVHYRPSAADHRGRLYPSQVGAAKLPKTLRLLLFGSDHHEIDLVGSHYQIFQRFHALSSTDPLPTVQQLRRLLADDMGNPPCTVLRERPKAPKDLPTHLLNATLEETFASYRQYGYYPSMQALHTLRTINRAKTQVFERLDALFGARTPIAHSTPWNTLKLCGSGILRNISVPTLQSLALYGCMMVFGFLRCRLLLLLLPLTCMPLLDLVFLFLIIRSPPSTRPIGRPTLLTCTLARCPRKIPPLLCARPPHLSFLYFRNVPLVKPLSA